MELSRDALRIERVANCDVFVGKGIKTPWNRLYGGQTIAQSLLAACLTVADDCPVHSLHSYFILAGDSSKEILFNVERTRNGGSFMTRAVKAMQSNKTICHTQVSFHREEFGYEFQESLEDLLKSRGITKLPDPESFRDSPSEDYSKHILRHSIGRGKNWRIDFVRVSSKNLINKGDWKTNCCMLTFLSDTGMVTIARQPHGLETEYKMALSLDHVIHFHRPLEVCVEDWLIVHFETKISRGARGLATAHFYNLSGNLLATVNQEGLFRPKDTKPKL